MSCTLVTSIGLAAIRGQLYYDGGSGVTLLPTFVVMLLISTNQIKVFHMGTAIYTMIIEIKNLFYA